MVEESIENQIIDLKAKNKNVWRVQGAVALSGSVAGLVYAINKKKSFWGKVGWWVLGGIVVGGVAGTGAYLINSKRNAEIEKLELESKEGE